ncbi:hypothetical protein MNV49_001860 [Pseudohyphozyma bogoriensis]|nr:hypothetical protein MNV49_001860 [Pseudohyphozyma bogoriensis]
MTASPSKPGIAVFCGSAPGNRPEYLEAANKLGQAIAKSNQPLIYGGGMNGLMGATAMAALDAGGVVHGVLPSAFIKAERTTTYNSFVPVHPKDATADSKYLQTPVGK